MFTEGMTPIRVFYTLVRYGEDGAKDYIDAFQNRNKGFQTFQKIISPFKNQTRADIKGLLRRDYMQQISDDTLFASLNKPVKTIIRELSVLLAFVAQGIEKPVEDMNISELISAFVEENDSTKKERMAGLLFKKIKGRVNYERTKKRDGSRVSSEELKDAFNSIYPALEGIGELDEKESFERRLNATGQLHSALLVLAYESEGSVSRKIAFFPIDELDVGGQYRKLGIDTPTDRKFVSVIYPDLWDNLELPKPRKSESFKDAVSAEGATSRSTYEVVQSPETSIKYIQFLANEKAQKRRGAMPNQIVKMLVPKISGRDMTKKNTVVFKKGKKGYTMNSYIRQLFESGIDYIRKILRGVIPLSDEEVREYFPGELDSGLYDRLFEFPDAVSYNNAIEVADVEEIAVAENEKANRLLVKDKNKVSDFLIELKENEGRIEFVQAEVERDVKPMPISTSLRPTNEHFLRKKGDEGAKLAIESFYMLGVSYMDLESLLTEDDKGNQETNEEFGEKIIEVAERFKREFDQAVLEKLQEITVDKRELYEKEFPQIFKELGFYELITERQGE
tara:strand:- start:4777 stop:6468 length:1692 start_codon:yes stop_codon:yes gene_type:complete